MKNSKKVLISSIVLFIVACSAIKPLSENDPSIEELRQKVMLSSENLDAILSSSEFDSQDLKYWSKVGIRGRYKVFKRDLSKSILESIVNEKAFLKGPHSEGLNFESKDTFGYYNPKFISKLQQRLNFLFNNQAFVENTQNFYDENLKQYLRTYYLSYDIAVKNKKVKEGYLRAISEPDKNSYNGFISGPSFYLQESFRDFAEAIERKGYNVYEGFTCPGFWVRRSVDGTADEFYKLLKITLKTFDPEFIAAQP
jgi:hypothetical protein